MVKIIKILFRIIIKIEDKISNLNPNVYHTFGMTETLSHFEIRHVGIDMPYVYQAIEGVRFSCKDNQLIVNYPGILDTALETKELIELIDDKKFKWIGRSDFTINSGGIKIIPEIIETKIDSILNWPFFIASLPDEYLGEKVILVIETESEVNMSKEDFASKLIRYEIPKEIFVVHQFVRTASGKINRLETIKQIKHAGFKIL